MGVALQLLGRYWPALAVLIIVVGAYQTGVRAERERGDAAALRVQVETLQRDRDIAQRAMIRSADTTAQLEAARLTDQEKIDALENAIRNRNAPGLSQSDLERLLDIR